MKNLKLLVILFFTFSAVYLHANPVTSASLGFTLDLPAGYELVDTNQKDRFLFQNKLVPCAFQVSHDISSKFSNVEKASESIFTQLNAKHKDMKFFWCNKDAFLSNFTFNNGVEYTGWLLVLKIKSGYLTLTAYSKTSDALKCEPTIISSLDTVFTDAYSYYIPGPVTTCLYNRNTELKTANVPFLDGSLRFTYSSIDAEAAKSVVDREFQVLTLSLNSKSIVEAWQRYYRSIFRDSWQRLQAYSFEVKRALEEKGLLKEPYKACSALLKQVQGFTYIRDRQGSDFTDLVTACTENTGDCDTRALLLNVVLSQIGIESVLLVSPEYSHALCGINIQGNGARMNDGKTSYLVAETTANVELGLIASDVADKSKYFVTKLYGLLK